MGESLKLKDEGNQFFKEKKFSEAIKIYSKALELKNLKQEEAEVLLKNRAACFLKLEKYSEAVVDCTRVLESNPRDAKALFRRCQGYEFLGKLEEAFKDGQELLKVEPKNQQIQPIMTRLHALLQEKYKKESSTDNKISKMFELSFNINLNESEDGIEKRKQALNNLLVLSKESSGAEKMFKNEFHKKLIQMVESEKNEELKVSAIRVIDSLCNNHYERSSKILEEISFKKLLLYISQYSQMVSLATTHLLKTIIISLTRLEDFKKEREKHEANRKADPAARIRPYPFIFQKIDPEIIILLENNLLDKLLSIIYNYKSSSYGRDHILEILIKFSNKKNGVGWSVKIIQIGGIQKLLTIAGVIPEKGDIKITKDTKMHISLLLSIIYEDLISDEERELFQKKAEEYFLDLFKDELIDSKLEAVLALSTILQGAPQVGNSLLSREGVMEIIMTMADSNDELYVKYAVEALVQSASKKDKCSGVIKEATPILKKLYQTNQSDAVKVRALVGLCKLGSFGGDDASVKGFSDGSNLTLSRACRKFLCNQSKNIDLRKWAAEGLAYLTLDADVKEEISCDKESLISLLSLSKNSDKSIIYPLSQILVNLTNCYDKKNIDPQLLELAKYAKQHIPEEHEKDKEPFIRKRIDRLVEAGVINTLVNFNKSESETTNELIARIYEVICTCVEHRGLVVQQGGVKSLLSLSLEGTEVGKTKASHSLAKIAITQNPQIAFPGQRAFEVIRPLLKLLSIDKTALENYESLLALTNLSSLGEEVRNKIIKEKGFNLIENYCYEDHDLLKLSATECICNLVLSDHVVELFKGNNDRLKLLILFSGLEDEKLARAASGALATLTFDPDLCLKFSQVTPQWLDILKVILIHNSEEIQHRAVFIVYNLINNNKQVAEEIIKSEILEILMAISKIEQENRKEAKILAGKCLEMGEKWGLISSVEKMNKKK